jgi:DNA-binding MarR family transcriptional regulator
MSGGDPMGAEPLASAPPSAPPGGPGLTQYTGYLLRRAYARSIDSERACLSDEASLREISVMATLLHDGATSQREIGDMLHVNRSVMVKVVDALEARGWVVRERNPEDRRSYALRLTSAGIEALDAAHVDLERLERDLTAELDDDQRRTLARHLRTLLAAEPVSEVESLGQVTAFLLTHAHLTLRARATAAFVSLGIDPRDFGILSVVEAEQPCSRVRIAARIGVTPPAVQGAIDALLDRGLIRRTTIVGDRRVHNLELTSEGLACLKSARRAAVQIQSDITRVLGDEAESELRELLRKVIS